MIDQQTRDKILEATNIVEVVSDFVSLRRSGVNYIGLCPFHNDRNPSFSVSPSKNICKCFVCGEGGGAVNFIMKHEQLSYADALRYLAKKYNIEIHEREQTDEERKASDERQSLFIVNEFAQKFFQDQLLQTEEGKNIGLTYFRERGISEQTIEKFGLGYSPEHRTAFTEAATGAGYPLERLQEVGLSQQYQVDQPAIDRFRGRIIFPVRNISGKYVAFGGRVLAKKEKIAKYINSPESAIYSKSRELYGLYWAKRAITQADKCYLVEGYTDVISMHQAGIENVVASSGTALTEQQIRQIKRFTNNVTVLYDGDSAGIKAAIRGIDLLLREGLNVRVALLPEGEDPDSFARTHSASELTNFLAEQEVDFIHFKTNLYQEEMRRDPIRRAELIQDILGSIAIIPDQIRRAVLIQSTANELKISEQILISEVRKLQARGFHTPSQQTVPTAPAPQGTTALSGSTNTAVAPPNSPAPPTSEDAGSQLSTDTSVPAQLSSPLSELSQPQPTYTREEEELLHLLLTLGDQYVLMPLPTTQTPQEGETMPQPQYVRELLAESVYLTLQEDKLLDTLSPVAFALLEEVVFVCLVQGISVQAHCINHANELFRKVASEVLSDKYPPEVIPDDRIFEEDTEEVKEKKRNEQIYRLEQERGRRLELALNYYRANLVINELKQLQYDLQDAYKAGRTEEAIALMKELQMLNQLKQQYSSLIGDRTIIG